MTFLCVDDSATVRKIISMALAEAGHSVIEAENGIQALEMLEHIADIAIVVSDVIMPGGINGRQLAATVLKNHPHMHVVLMSGYTDEAQQGSGDELPVLAKPFSRRELARAMQNADRGKS